MDFIGDTKINWLKFRWYFIGFSLIVTIIGALDAARKGGLSYGIDFSEGTIVYVKFENRPEVDVIRRELRGAGIEGSVIQRYGREELNTVMIRAGRQTGDGGELDTAANTILENARKHPEQ